jgi:hypothetical protein
VECPHWHEVRSVVFSCCWASPAQYIVVWLMSIFYCLNFWDSSNLESQVAVFIYLQEQGSPVIPPGIGFSDFVVPLALIMKPLVGPNIKLCFPTDFLLLCHMKRRKHVLFTQLKRLVGLHSLCLEKVCHIIINGRKLKCSKVLPSSTVFILS